MVIVTSAGKPSGTAATAKPMAAEISSSMSMWWTIRPMRTMTTAMTPIPIAMYFPSFASLRDRGVSISSTSSTILVMRPISVFIPVAVTTPTTLPLETMVEEKIIEERSPTPASEPTGRLSFSLGSDSPVRAASSTRKFVDSSIRRSAGALSPAARRTMSPGTRSSAGTFTHAPSRSTSASRDNIFLMPSRAFSACPSWMNPVSAIATAATRMTVKSTQSPIIAFNPADPSRM